MIKIFGSLLILLACSGAGFLIAQGYINRSKEIRQMQNIVAYIETEIIYGHTPLFTIMKNISERENGSISKIFALIAEEMKSNHSSFALCWKTAFGKLKFLTSLKDREIQIMLHLGSILGQSDRENQQKHLRIALTHLQTEEQNAQEQQYRYEKLFRTLGILTGILIVILLF